MFVCPNCRQKRGVNISYGYPSPELIQQVERNEAVLGGCMQAIGDPDRQCLNCGHQWENTSGMDQGKDRGAAAA